MAESGFADFIQGIFEYLVESFGVLGLPAAILVLIIVMIIQAIIAPIVSEAILASAGGILYEAFGIGGIYAAIIGGVIGSLLGAIASFFIARWLQRQAKQRIVDKYSDEELAEQGWWDNLMTKLGNFLSRFIDEDSEDFIEIIEE